MYRVQKYTYRHFNNALEAAKVLAAADETEVYVRDCIGFYIATAYPNGEYNID